MANKEHVQVLISALASMSMKTWNQWRMENPGVLPDLSGEELNLADLSFINLSNADLSRADLSGAKLHHANLQRADLRGSQFRNADLSRADMSFACLRGADLRSAVLRKAILYGANLKGANLGGADLGRADLTDALVDEGASIRSTNWFSSGVSRLEKKALGFFGRGLWSKARGEGAALGIKSGRPSSTTRSR